MYNDYYERIGLHNTNKGEGNWDKLTAPIKTPPVSQLW